MRDTSTIAVDNCTMAAARCAVAATVGHAGPAFKRLAQLAALAPALGACEVLAALQGGRFELSGVPRMHERPIADLVDALRGLGCRIEYLGTDGYPPLLLSGTAGGTLQTQTEIRVRGDVSSQFLTALLLALPLASASAALVIAADESGVGVIRSSPETGTAGRQQCARPRPRD